MEEILKIAILGAGAMGLIFASVLSEKNQVFLIDHRKEKITRLNKEGIEVKENNDESKTSKIPCYKYDEDMPRPDIIFVFIKAIKNLEALRNISRLISEDTILVSLQNGYGNDKDLEEFQDKNQVVIGSTTHGATQLSYGKIFHAGSGMTYLGQNDFNYESVKIVKKVLEESGFDLEVSHDIDRLVIEKLFINIGINAITALLDRENACIYKDDYAREMSKNLVYEACEIFNLEGFDFDKEKTFEKVLMTAEKTGKNTSSMRADLLKGNETEIDKINKVIVDKARKQNRKSPYNEAISLLIKAKEEEL